MTEFNVLVAEDKEYLLKVIVANLPRSINCLEAGSLEEAIEKLPDADAVILSSGLPGGNGSALTALKQKKNIPVVCITSDMSSGARINLLKEGADDVMFKPFNPEELALRLLRLLKQA